MVTGMYPNTKTWNPFVGCNFDCDYCEKSFKRQLKRVGGTIGCADCSNYKPHYHPERLKKIPSAPIVFVCGTGDISFCDRNYTLRIIDSIKKHKPRKPKTFYFQSKAPQYFKEFLGEFPENVILLTTLESNRDGQSQEISKAPPPSVRWSGILGLDYPRKVVTIEPVMDFDEPNFLNWILRLRDQGSLEYVWFGFDSKKCGLPEPSIEKAQRFVYSLQENEIEVRGKELRGITV